MAQLSQLRFRWAAPLVLVVVLAAQVVTHLAWLPISAHSGQLAIPVMMNDGRTLFGDLLEQHAPATSVLSALAMRLTSADPILVTRALNLLLILALTLLIYTLANSLAGQKAAVLAVLTWFLWEPVYGNILFYFDTLAGTLILLALVVWRTLGERQPGWLAPLLCGLLLGGATLAKQHAWGAVILFAAWLILYKRNKVPLFALGALCFPLAAVLIVAAQGNGQNYVYWNWLFNFSGLMDNAAPTGDLIRKLLLTNVFVPAFLLMALRNKDDRFWLLVGLLWGATLLDLLPRFGDIHAMAHLPLACVISGVVLAKLPLHVTSRVWWRQANASELTLTGIIAVLLVGWLWTSAAPYFSAPLGRAGIPAYDEFKPLAVALDTLSEPGDSLFVLPETDSTPQIHAISGLLPPGTWIKGWRWYLEAPGIMDQLLAEWAIEPPAYMVIFPDLLEVGQPPIQPLVDFTEAHYELVETVPEIVFHGDAQIYRYTG